ncbi:MAG: pyridoxamine 5'-phosphate oxidase family protein [Microbacterium sp.]|uniref:pyridoxamine 5'-phosphate oxidase family protein n=1 Tax=Microbacterium sp. TaxID=51671 RepID=UPI0039E3E857
MPAEPTAIDLRPLAEALDSAMARERPVVIAVVDVNGDPAVTFRGSVQVYSPDQLSLWVRKEDTGFAADIQKNPRVNVLYYDPQQGPDGRSSRRVALTGRARLAPELNEQIWNSIPEPEKERTSLGKGVAAIVDVDAVDGFGGQGPVTQRRGL